MFFLDGIQIKGRLSGKMKYLALMLVVLVLAACGYRFTGSGSLPAGVETIAVIMLENRTAEIGLENTITNDLINEFVLHKKDSLVSQDEADGILSGSVESLWVDTISQSGAGAALERRVNVSVSMKLTDLAGKVIWDAKSISANETFNVSSDRQETDENQDDAMIDLSKRLAETVYNRLTEDF